MRERDCARLVAWPVGREVCSGRVAHGGRWGHRRRRGQVVVAVVVSEVVIVVWNVKSVVERVEGSLGEFQRISVIGAIDAS